MCNRSDNMRLRKKAWAKPLLDDYTNRIVITKLDFYVTFPFIEN